MNNSKKILFIINPKSEKIAEQEFESLITELQKEYKFNYEILHTTGKKDNVRINDKINKYQPELVIAVGGDGTVNMVGSNLIGSRIEFGIIPAGSANGLAYNLDIPADTKEAFQKILTSAARPVDAININENFICFHLSDIGINARIVERFEKEGAKGLGGYGKQMIKEWLSKRKAFTFRLKTPGLNKIFKAEMLVIANAERYGTGAIINPDGSMKDGKFEFIIIRPYPWWSFLTLLIRFFLGNLDKMRYVKQIRTEKGTIELKNPQSLQVDGEIYEDIDKLEVRIIPEALWITY